MRSVSALLLTLLLASCYSGAYDGPVTAIVNVTVIDAASGAQEGMTVLVAGDRITTVGGADEVAVPEGATVVDGAGKYLLPGLWDAHVHFAYDLELAPAMFNLFLANGITSVRDTGGLLDLVMPWHTASRSGEVAAPTVFAAGPLVDGTPHVYDGSPGRPELAVGVATPEEARAMVDSLAAAGVDLIKAYEMLTPEAFQAALDQAEEHGLPVTGHVPLSMLAENAARAGMSSMEHLRNLEMACSADADSLLGARRQMLADGASDPGGVLRSRLHNSQRQYAISTHADERCEMVLNALLEADTWQVPTLTILMARSNRLWADPDWRANFAHLPEPVRTQWMDGALQMSDSPRSEPADVFAAWGQNMIGSLKEVGVPIMAGTDTPIFFLTPGYSLHKELELLVGGGLTPLEAIEAATARPAAYFGLEADLGHVQPGMWADLLLLDADPLADIRNTTSIQAVIKRGRFFDRVALDGLLEEAAAAGD